MSKDAQKEPTVKMKTYRITLTLGPSKVSFTIEASDSNAACAVAEQLMKPGSLFHLAIPEIERVRKP